MRFSSFLGVALAAVGVTANPFVEIQQREHINQIASKLPLLQQQLSESIKQVHSLGKQFDAFSAPAKTRGFAALDATTAPTGSISAACSASLTTLQSSITTCGLSLTLPTAAATTIPGTTVDPLYSLTAWSQQICSQKTCFSTVQSNFASFQSACSVEIAGVTGQTSVSIEIQSAIQELTLVNKFIAVGCLQDSAGNYCLTSFITAANSLSTATSVNPLAGGSGIPVATLNSLCSPCSLKVAAALSTIDNSISTASISASFNLLCIQDPNNAGQYCINTMAALIPTASPTTSTGGSSSSSSSMALFSGKILCAPCFQKLIAATIALTQATASSVATTTLYPGQIVPSDTTTSLSSVATMISSLCIVNQSGQRCVDVIFNNLASLESSFGSRSSALTTSCATLSVSNGTCSAACAGAISSTFGPLGCCLGSLGAAVGAASGGASVTTGFSDFQVIALKCGLGTQFASCQSGGKVSLTITLPNLSYTFYAVAANTLTLNAKIIADISTATGAPASSISIVVTAAKTGAGVSIAVTITTASSGDATALSNALNIQLAAGGTGIAFPQTAQFASANNGVNSPSASMVSGTDSTTATATGGSAKLQSSVLFLGLIAIVMAFLRQ